MRGFGLQITGMKWIRSRLVTVLVIDKNDRQLSQISPGLLVVSLARHWGLALIETPSSINIIAGLRNFVEQ